MGCPYFIFLSTTRRLNIFILQLYDRKFPGVCFLKSNFTLSCCVNYYIVMYNFARITFYSLIKPFKWPHPIILNMPQSLEPVLDSPVPIIIGKVILCIYFKIITGIN